MTTDASDLIAGFEGFTPRAKWDHKQWTSGYGTKALGPDEVIDEVTARARLKTETDAAASAVDKAFPGLAPHQRTALTSFTYNLGPGWMSSPTRLRAAIEAGDWNTAAQVIQEYNKASGKVEPGLVTRRGKEAGLFLGGPAPPPSLSSTLAAGGGSPMAYTQDGIWVPQEAIDQDRGVSQHMRGLAARRATGLGDALAIGLNSWHGGLRENRAMDAVRSNQAMQADALRRASGAGDADSMAKMLINSGIPGLAGQGANMVFAEAAKRAEEKAALAQMEAKAKLEQRIKWENFNRFLGGMRGSEPAASPAGPAGGAAPTPPPAGGPGVTSVNLPPEAAQAAAAAAPPPAVSSPATGPAAGVPAPPGRQGPLVDDARIGAGIAAGILPKEAAEYFAKDPQKKFNEAYDAAAGKRSEESLGDIQKGGVAARQQLQNWQVLRDLVNNPALLQGPMAKQFSVPLRRMAEFFGVKTDGLKETAIFESLINEMALQGRNPAGGAGMPGSMSDKDLAFLQSIVPALGNTREANALLIDIRMRMLKRQAEVAELARRYKANKDGRFDPDGFEDVLKQWADANPLFSDAERAQLMGQHGVTPPAAGTGQTAAAPAAAPPATPEAQAAVQAELAKKMAGAKKGDTITIPAQGDKPAQKKVFDGTTWQDAGVIDSIKEGIDTKGAAKVTDDVVGWLTRQLPDFSGSQANAAPATPGNSLENPLQWQRGMDLKSLKPGMFVRLPGNKAVIEIIDDGKGGISYRDIPSPLR